MNRLIASTFVLVVFIIVLKGFGSSNESKESKYYSFRSYSWKEELLNEDLKILREAYSQQIVSSQIDILIALSVHFKIQEISSLYANNENPILITLKEIVTKFEVNGFDDHLLNVFKSYCAEKENISSNIVQNFILNIAFARKLRDLTSGSGQILNSFYKEFSKDQKKCLEVINEEKDNAIFQLNRKYNFSDKDSRFCINCLISSSDGRDVVLELFHNECLQNAPNILELNLLARGINSIYPLLTQDHKSRLSISILIFERKISIADLDGMIGYKILKGILSGESDDAILESLKVGGVKNSDDQKYNKLRQKYIDEQNELKENIGDVPIYNERKSQVVLPEDKFQEFCLGKSEFELIDLFDSLILYNIDISERIEDDEYALLLRSAARVLGKKIL